MNVLVFDAWCHVRDAVRYCKRNREPLAEFTFRGRVYVIQRLKIGWILWRGRVRATNCKKTVFRICPCRFFTLSAAMIIVMEYLGLRKQSPDPSETTDPS